MGTVDLSRVGTDFRKRYAGVRMQQGRVLSDDVFNNAECIDEEDMRRTRIDVIGPVGSPDSGFLPVVPAGPLAVPGKVQFSIAAGTLYLGGLRIEEPAAEPFHLQKDWVNFDIGDPNQWPDLPAAGTRVDLVWIEAWQQPVAAEEDSEKFEVSLGSADIDMNMRTMRRIMVSPGVKTDDCAMAWANALTAWSPALGTPFFRGGLYLLFELRFLALRFPQFRLKLRLDFLVEFFPQVFLIHRGGIIARGHECYPFAGVHY